MLACRSSSGRRWPLAITLAALLLSVPPLSPAVAQRPPFRPDFAAIHINDVYRIDAVEDGTAGGLGRIATLARQVRSQARAPVVILHGGDFIAPSLESTYWGGLQMIDAMNFVHDRAPVFAVPGNHEFDEERPATLVTAMKASRFPWLASNLNLVTGDSAADALVRPDTVVVLDGTPVGLFGLTKQGSHRGRDQAYTRIDADYVGVARARILDLERRGAEVIVAITHLDMDEDREVARLRREHPKFLWIAGGHEHYALSDPLTDSTALITKADSNARSAWKVFVASGDGVPLAHAEHVRVGSEIRVDGDYRKRIEQRYRAELEQLVPLFGQAIGSSRVRLDGTEETVRNEESNWGNYLTDVMRNAYPGIPADVAVLHGGTIRIDDAFSGEIRFEHLLRTFGFPTRVAYVWLTGADIRQYLLEHSVGGARGEGRFLQVSGLRFTFDRQRPAGDRVTELQVQAGDSWTPLDPAKLYIVAVPDYLYFGGDGYIFRSRAPMTLPPGPDLKLLTFDALTRAHARGTPIAPMIEGRIVEVK